MKAAFLRKNIKITCLTNILKAASFVQVVKNSIQIQRNSPRLKNNVLDENVIEDALGAFKNNLLMNVIKIACLI